ncbi:MAG: cupin domain-containing protein [Dissulfurispiraceae bacterium]|jgi:quercetin dioxygenase-like cupin family protein
MTKKKKETATKDLACDWFHRTSGERKGVNENKIYRHKGACKWSGIRKERYKQKDGGWSEISRNVLIGNRGESAKFHLRYFEIAAGGFSSLEKHLHEHVVVCIKGKGRVIIGEKSHVIKHLDTVYISPNTVHQLSNPYDVPFGFFCIVNAKRDRPRLVER